ncbi:MAG: (2Fe-2S)-binding protein [Bacillota bacterium]
MRVEHHPILGPLPAGQAVTITVDGIPVAARTGEPIAAALMAAGHHVFRYTPRRHEPRGVFCAIGRCTDCIMTVDGVPNVRTCVTPVRPGMEIRTQEGLGRWSK